MLLLDTHVVSEVRKHSWHPNVKAGMIAQAAGTLYICAITVLEIQRGVLPRICRTFVRSLL
ncbi:hypothetical protein QTI27_35620 [Variovorax sp. J31P216]|nr:hypothetical protein [Variovorax sp. J31P216]